MGGGEKKPAMSPAERDFDVVLVGMLTIFFFFFYLFFFLGGMNATALTKFL